MYLNKEELKTASVESILKELDIVNTEIFRMDRSLPLSKTYALRAYSNRLLEEIKTRIEHLEVLNEQDYSF